MDTAERMKRALFTDWIIKAKTADDVFPLLKLGNEGETTFENTVWSTRVHRHLPYIPETKSR
ncbi:hypothetical protein PHMEG_00016626 [Phytophthora megakarya]|uniref:Uncharacterized protein n=1 Tax=Phytophthora megakarya TaxID=4795 RepID=A0A225VYT1_9STRA|nr:hypothetical protein PHMEG_00016626 [Phytophthora megakarya]